MKCHRKTPRTLSIGADVSRAKVIGGLLSASAFAFLCLAHCYALVLTGETGDDQDKRHVLCRLISAFVDIPMPLFALWLIIRNTEKPTEA